MEQLLHKKYAISVATGVNYGCGDACRVILSAGIKPFVEKNARDYKGTVEKWQRQNII
jgi:hypothetical protein